MGVLYNTPIELESALFKLSILMSMSKEGLTGMAMTKGRAINDLGGGGLGQIICVDFFFLSN